MINLWITQILFKAEYINDRDWWWSQVTQTSSVSREGAESMQGAATPVCFKFSLANNLEEKQAWKRNTAPKTNLSGYLVD